MSRRALSPPSFKVRSTGPPEPLVNLEIEVVTPLFGGGVDAGETHPRFPIRAQTVRGHLRFWWRACVGPRFATAKEMFAAERAIWGAAGSEKTTRRSAVNVIVTTTNPGALDEGRGMSVTGPNRWGIEARGWPRANNRAYAYALFPFQGDNQNPPRRFRTDVSFRLRIEPSALTTEKLTDDERAEVLAAVWAWITFGGVGARTRRGCGALWTADDRFQGAPDGADVAATLAKGIRARIEPGNRRLLHPILAGGRFILGTQRMTPLQAWNEAVGLMQEYRQGPDVGRDPGRSDPRRPSRSRWPEPDTMRERLRVGDRQYRPRHPAKPAYPRADLGMPIIFQRLDPRNNRSQWELRPSEKGQARMASPVILKPLMLDREVALPMVFILSAPHVWDHGAPAVEMAHNNRRVYPIGPRHLQVDTTWTPSPMGTEIDARSGLLALAEERDDWANARTEL